MSLPERRVCRWLAASLIGLTSAFYGLFVFVLHPLERFVYSDMGFLLLVANRLQYDVATADDLLKPIGYPLLAAASFAITGGVGLIKLLHWAAATATLPLLWRASAEAFGERTALLALTAACGHYPFLVLAGFALPETLFIALVAGMLYLMVRTRCLTRASAAEACTLGLLFGLAFWLRGNIALLAPLLLTWLCLRVGFDPLRRFAQLARVAVRQGAAFCSGVLLLLVLHLAATGLGYGQARLSSPAGGLNFIEGKCDTQLNYDSHGLSSLSPLAVQRGPVKARHWNAPFTDDAFYWRAGFACIADDPGVLLDSFRYLYFLFYGNRLWPADTTTDAALNAAYHRYFGTALVPGLLVGLVFVAARPLRPAGAPYLLLALTLFLASWLFKSELRYRIPFDVAFLPLAIHGWDRVAGRRITRWGPGFWGAEALLIGVLAWVFVSVLL